MDKDLERVRAGIDKEEKRLEKEKRRQERELSSLGAQIEKDRQALESLLEDRVEGFEFIASAWADYELAKTEAQAAALRSKSHPAHAAADAVRDKGRDLAEMRRRAKRAEWVSGLYEWHFPWLEELRYAPEEEAYVKGDTKPMSGEPRDPAGDWLSKEEYAALSSTERNQRALERYLKSRKTPWQLGRDYERYVGYLREQDGHSVTYHGIFKGLEDLGRDLLAEKDDHIEVIQCKRWAKAKTIHEKHIFQLFGTMVLARMEEPNKKVSGTFTTTTSLSEKARQVADFLGIKVEERFPLSDYPRIKCNLARVTGDRIYHLPFDQQYDKTIIEPHRGERYAETVAEAEELGFRRAWRWKGAGPEHPAAGFRGAK